MHFSCYRSHFPKTTRFASVGSCSVRIWYMQMQMEAIVRDVQCLSGHSGRNLTLLLESTHNSLREVMLPYFIQYAVSLKTIWLHRLSVVSLMQRLEGMLMSQLLIQQCTDCKFCQVAFRLVFVVKNSDEFQPCSSHQHSSQHGSQNA